MNTFIGAIVGFIFLWVVGTYISSVMDWAYSPPWEWEPEVRGFIAFMSLITSGIGGFMGWMTKELR
jgi:hypothetical protein